MDHGIYEELREKLDNSFMGAPPADEIYEILRELFTEDEARLAVQLKMSPEEYGVLASRIGMPEAELLPMLERMADKGLVLHLDKKGKKHYAVLPLIPGIFELQFMKAETTPEKTRMARLFDSYYHNGWGNASFGHKQAFARVIPVEKEIPSMHEIQPYEKVSELIDNATAFALTNCYCRHEAELLGKSCGAPKDVCMIFGPFADFAVERGFARSASKEDMEKALDAAEAAGLVHVSDNVQMKINFICNCCGCCCGLLGTITKLKIPTAVAASRYIADIDPDICIGCGECENRCHVKAIKVNTEAETAALTGENLCIGCGLCVSTCPTGALSMKLRPEWTEPKAAMKDLVSAISDERKSK
jgi:Na+-translocating ferredoxin:NAD+ oxidoreductase subunit B